MGLAIAFGEEELDAQVDEMLSNFEKAGKSHDQCRKAMEQAIDRAHQPFTILEWIEAAKLDPAGRRKYADTLFDPEEVKAVILQLLKMKKVIRLGVQTFCSRSVVGEMTDAIDNIMMWECAICDIPEMAELLSSYRDCEPRKKKNGQPISPKKNTAKIKNFIEEKIVLLAMDEMESLVKIDGDFVHYATIETCVNYAMQACGNRSISPQSRLDFFDMVRRVNFTGVDKQFDGRSITKIKEVLSNDTIRNHVLDGLVKKKVISVVNDRIVPHRKPDRYLWLDE